MSSAAASQSPAGRGKKRKKHGRAVDGRKSRPNVDRPAAGEPTESASATQNSSFHSFMSDPRDHCETSQAAYEHVAPVLQLLVRSHPNACLACTGIATAVCGCTPSVRAMLQAERLGKPREDLLIYDPYYCAGGVANHLAEEGFTNVYNRNEDFYAVVSSGRVPPVRGGHTQRTAARTTPI